MVLRLLLVLILLLSGCSPAERQPAGRLATAPPDVPTRVFPLPTRVPSATAPPHRNIVGVHLLLDDGRNVWPASLWRSHLHAARDQVGAGGYVVQLVRDDDLDVDRWQQFFDLCAEFELRPILRLATTFDREGGFWRAPTPGPDNGYAQSAAAYATFVIGLRWPTEEHPVIVGNEPNHGDEWGGTADPAAYARFLRDVAQALHSADPAVVVLNAALDPYSPHTNGQAFSNGFTYLDSTSFLEAMQDAVPGIFTHIDAWASHPYPTGPMANGPWDQAFQIDRINGAEATPLPALPPGSVNRGINGYVWELRLLEQYGVVGLEVWITETGWRHAESVAVAAADNGRSWPPARVVGEWVDLALYGNHGRYPDWPDAGWTAWADDPRVRAVVFFALNGAPHEWGHTNWLQLDPDGAILGAYPLRPDRQHP